MPITRLRELNEGTMLAEGSRFDLEKVLAAGSSVLRVMIGRAQMRFPETDPLRFTSEEPEAIPETAATLEEIEAIFRKIKQERFDAASLHYIVEFGPYLATWAPLGFDMLYGPLVNCVTSAEENWEDFDPTPALFFTSRAKPFFPMGPKETKFLSEIGGECLRGTDAYFLPDDINAWMLVIRFPHETFGAGRGLIRIQRGPL